MKQILTFILILSQVVSYGQKTGEDIYKLPIPQTLEDCFTVLDQTLSEEEINLIKTLPEDSISLHDAFINKPDFFHAWKLYSGSRLTKDFQKKGIYGTNAIYETILITYHRHLNNKPVKIEDQIEKYQLQQKQAREAYQERLKKDTINGVYIPKDLNDCFLTLDKMLSKEDIATIKTMSDRKETAKLHQGLGMGLRNGWGLWGGSRLQKYLLERKISHPDSMSATILEYYYDWLNSRNEDWVKFDENNNNIHSYLNASK